MGDLRPTLFLAQLSNLLAGNISIVHGVTGASRTFMGEESSGVDAIRIARERIASGQDDIFLVGGAYNAERPDVLLIYEMGGFLWKKPYRPVWERPAEGGGMILGIGRLLPGARIARACRRARREAARGHRGRRLRPLPPQGRAASRQRSMPCRSSSEPSPTWCCPARPASRASRTRSRRLSRTSRRRPPCMPPAISSATRSRHRPPRAWRSPQALIAEGKAGEALVTSVGHWRGEGAIRLTKA